MALSKSRRIQILLAIDTVFFLLEISIGKNMMAVAFLPV
jgi:hypothetical protein